MLARIALGIVSLGIVACSQDVVGAPGDRAAADGGAGVGDYVSTGANAAKGPPPTITSVSPRSGAYGTEVTVTGTNLQEATLSLGGDPAPVTYVNPGTMSSEATGPAPEKVIVAWSDTEIKFRYPFPADGAVRVTSSGGTADGGAFVPTWSPGKGASGRVGRKALLGAVSPAPGTTVAAFDDGAHPRIVVTRPDGAIDERPLDRGSVALGAMSLYVDAAGKVDAFFVRDGHLWRSLDLVGGGGLVDTGVATTMAAGGEDATGPFAWVKSGATLQRLRPPAWSADATVADPTPTDAPGVSMAVGTEQSLFVGWGVSNGGSFPFYDVTTHPEGKRLRPGMSTFDATVRVGGGIDDAMLWTRFFPGPGLRVASYYCATDSGVFETTSTVCTDGYRGSDVAPETDDIRAYVVGFDATTSIAASCSASTGVLSLGPETSTADQVPALFPCPEIVAVTVDPSHAGAVIVSSGGYLYAPKMR